ncbi:hypothetical protein A2U01_0003359 [Trifolium medium]|uniref:Uncharacterized protein n=1 Tax=Trifolium medium TaxID=97028 RepID=A0A392M590_9FABA|nr:hypothetical protein [Trifolium medium]
MSFNSATVMVSHRSSPISNMAAPFIADLKHDGTIKFFVMVLQLVPLNPPPKRRPAAMKFRPNYRGLSLGAGDNNNFGS